MSASFESLKCTTLDHFVGRDRELERFTDIFQRTLDGQRQLLLVSGDPGIGKTSYAEAIAEIAEDRGALVIWARCYEEPGAPPYWPWTQALRAYSDAGSLDEISVTMGSSVSDIAAILPEVSVSADSAATPPDLASLSKSPSSRFRMFAGVARFLGLAAETVPLVLIIDNLHWADGPSLSLLEFCCQELYRKRLLICATFRESEVSRTSPLYDTLGGLSSLAGTNRIHLGGLPENDIGRLAANLLGRELPSSILEPVYRQTDGNPLYARELIKYLIDEIADSASSDISVHVPDSIRETIGRRLSRLPQQSNTLLGVASVFGRYFEIAELAQSLEQPLAEIYDALEPAIDARIVERVDGAAERFRFTHALIRETLYEEASALNRLQLHASAGDALLKLHADCPASVLSRIAYHFSESASLGNAEKAAHFGMQAAQSAMGICAYEEAVLHFDRVIAVLEVFAKADDERIACAYLGKGIALKVLGLVEQSIEALLKAIHTTGALGNVELLVHVLMQLAISTSHSAQTQVIPLLEATLDVLPDEEDIARAQATLMLAFARCTRIEAAELILSVTKAVSAAKKMGAGEMLCDCYHIGQLALRGQPGTLEQRLSLSGEHVATALETQIPDCIAEAYHWQSMNLLEAGDTAEVDSVLRRLGNLPASSYGLHQYRYESLRIIMALLRGSWSGLESRIDRLKDIGRDTRRDDAIGVYGAQMFALERDLGRLDNLATLVHGFSEKPASAVWQPGLMVLCTELNLLDDARRIFESLTRDGFAQIQKDEMYLTGMVFCAETCAKLEDRERAAELIDLLTPYADMTANHPTAVCYGAVTHYLGMLTATVDDVTRATDYFEQALGKHREMSAWPWLARTQVRFAAMLMRSDDDTCRTRGRKMLGDAESLATRLNMRGLAAEAADMLHAKTGASMPDGLTAREGEVLELLAIGRSNRDISKVLSISLNTVATHVRSILTKSGCANRTEAAAYAIRHGFDNPSRQRR